MAILKNLIHSQELMAYLTGKKVDNRIACKFTNLPTDPHLVLDSIEDDLVNNKELLQVFINTLIEMSQHTDYAWFVTYYLVGIVRIQQKINRKLINEEFILAIREGLLKNKKNLENDKRWVGNMWDNGLWGDVQRMSNNLKDDYGISLV